MRAVPRTASSASPVASVWCITPLTRYSLEPPRSARSRRSRDISRPERGEFDVGHAGSTVGRAGRVVPRSWPLACRDDPGRPAPRGASHPDKPPIIGYCGDRLDRTVSYREFGLLVDRFAAALIELGVGRQDVVAIHLPNRWMVSPLYLACARIGAVPAPVMPALGSGNSARVDQQRGQGLPGPGQLRAASTTRPAGRRRAGQPGPSGGGARPAPSEPSDGTVDFADFFLNTPWEQTHQLPPLSELRADDVRCCCSPPAPPASPRASRTATTRCTPGRSRCPSGGAGVPTPWPASRITDAHMSGTDLRLPTCR